ncbi:aminoacyl-histidine dipeptidase [Paratrimastix pyriformis]|uniref:Aminoacyl-histidine dipeptidase n=1 Tax=Paratrimastix pyriformis TaxID=342808 RepID=A0ABQ8UJG7_9EUKA|nr:aminoacyl-histidine dipeptidase [Paratrimastix pyriformis]
MFKLASPPVSLVGPRGHMDEIRDKIQLFADSWGFESERDSYGNLVVRKPASPGLENRQYVCLQAHMDMVCEKDPASTHDFAKDPIVPRIVGNKMMATGTTLGADNGVGVALGLMILEDRAMRHGPLEVLFTADEEVGPLGAMAISPGLLRSRRLVNLDSEEDWRVCVGCGGGFECDITIDFPPAPPGSPGCGPLVAVTLEGLTGGHSADAIHQGGANAIQTMARTLLQVGLLNPAFRYHQASPPAHHQAELIEHRVIRPSAAPCGLVPAPPPTPLSLLLLRGGTLANAIPVSCTAVVRPPAGVSLRQLTERLQGALPLAEYRHTDPGMALRVEALASPAQVMARLEEAVASLEATELSPESSRALLEAVLVAPHGAFRMMEPENSPAGGLAETSANFFMVTYPHQGAPTARLEFFPRSSSNSQLGWLHDRLASLANLIATACPSRSALLGARCSPPRLWVPGWHPRWDSPLLAAVRVAYRQRGASGGKPLPFAKLIETELTIPFSGPLCGGSSPAHAQVYAEEVGAPPADGAALGPPGPEGSRAMLSGPVTSGDFVVTPRPPEIEAYAMHAMIECGLLAEAFPGMDCVSIGPSVFDVHTPQEALVLDSVPRTARLIERLLADLP